MGLENKCTACWVTNWVMWCTVVALVMGLETYVICSLIGIAEFSSSTYIHRTQKRTEQYHILIFIMLLLCSLVAALKSGNVYLTGMTHVG